MPESTTISGRAAALRIDNLDTDQIMPKQFLRGIDKAGLDCGLFYDLRFDAQGRPRRDFVLNRPEHAGTAILLGGANFGCGSSREHAVWGLQQFGIRAVIASSFGEIFYSNAMNNRLALVVLAETEVSALMAEAEAGQALSIDLGAMQVRGASVNADFQLSSRHRRMFVEGLDVIGLSLSYREQIEAFARSHWERQPWLQDVARRTRERLV
ncbi:3-isopropylmalate dehydratase small subunit [Paucibacter sp. PLA-PC-4]|uniref:3-isopropylmalate dehydratase small subunit n=1 Tax=Paucibacter sp. PLA-PC-4 TaxID=2993655 RepID=UPI00224B17CE|nr:3-isopropylmalate dehydratase small subunit [Paucibacter sp. PLA-PC-4]MCX2865494.1 3-isopropylmalate dehydratase small subunit [Paucibacter sp. PLA-PC-4]